jgi:nucleoid DNA-binding protein
MSSNDYVSSRDLMKDVARRAGVSVYLAEKILTAISDESISILQEGKSVKIRGLVTLRPQMKESHEIYSPYDHKKIMLSAHTIIKAYSSTRLKKEVK